MNLLLLSIRGKTVLTTTEFKPYSFDLLNVMKINKMCINFVCGRVRKNFCSIQNIFFYKNKNTFFIE